MQLVSRTGGVAALAHPWALKNPEAAIKNLKAAGLHGIEVYRSDGKLSGMTIFSSKALAIIISIFPSGVNFGYIIIRPYLEITCHSIDSIQ